MESSFWNEMASNPPEERGSFEELPPDVYVAMKTAGTENGKAAPEVRVKETRDKTAEFRVFSVGLLTIGGAAPLTDSAEGRMIYLDAFIEPSEKELEKAKGPQAIASRFTGILNTLFASGIAEGEKDKDVRSAARWSATLKTLQKTAEANNITIDQYEGNAARYIAGLAVKTLEEGPRKIIVKTKKDTWEKDGEKKSAIKVGSFEDFTTANIEKRKIVMFGDNKLAF